jgi:hypothetical protein
MKEVTSCPGLACFLLARHQLRNGLCGFGATLDPDIDLFSVQFDGFGAGVRIVCSNLFDVSTVTRKALVADDDTIKGFFFAPCLLRRILTLIFVVPSPLMERVGHSVEQ